MELYDINSFQPAAPRLLYPTSSLDMLPSLKHYYRHLKLTPQQIHATELLDLDWNPIQTLPIPDIEGAFALTVGSYEVSIDMGAGWDEKRTEWVVDGVMDVERIQVGVREDARVGEELHFNQTNFGGNRATFLHHISTKKQMVAADYSSKNPATKELFRPSSEHFQRRPHSPQLNSRPKKKQKMIEPSRENTTIPQLEHRFHFPSSPTVLALERKLNKKSESFDEEGMEVFKQMPEKPISLVEESIELDVRRSVGPDEITAEPPEEDIPNVAQQANETSKDVKSRFKGFSARDRVNEFLTLRGQPQKVESEDPEQVEEIDNESLPTKGVIEIPFDYNDRTLISTSTAHLISNPNPPKEPHIIIASTTQFITQKPLLTLLERNYNITLYERDMTYFKLCPLDVDFVIDEHTAVIIGLNLSTIGLAGAIEELEDRIVRFLRKVSRLWIILDVGCVSYVYLPQVYTVLLVLISSFSHCDDRKNPAYAFTPPIMKNLSILQSRLILFEDNLQSSVHLMYSSCVEETGQMIR